MRWNSAINAEVLFATVIGKRLWQYSNIDTKKNQSLFIFLGYNCVNNGLSDRTSIETYEINDSNWFTLTEAQNELYLK